MRDGRGRGGGRRRGDGGCRAGFGIWPVHVPGGRLAVTLGETTSLLTGPAFIVAEGDLTEDWPVR